MEKEYRIVITSKEIELLLSHLDYVHDNTTGKVKDRINKCIALVDDILERGITL